MNLESSLVLLSLEILYGPIDLKKSTNISKFCHLYPIRVMSKPSIQLHVYSLLVIFVSSPFKIIPSNPSFHPIDD